MSSYSNASVVPTTSRLNSVLGVWKRTDIDQTISSDAVEVDALRESSLNCFLPVQSPAVCSAYYDNSKSSPHAHALGTSRLSHETLSVPPPYSPRGSRCMATENHTGISSDEELPTVARMLFMYGFFFFPFWLAGICILRMPLLPTADWEAGKSEVEKAQLSHLLRKTELKWARRCLWAMFGLLGTVFFLFLIIKFALLYTH